MSKFFVVANSRAAPSSVTIKKFVDGSTAEQAMESFRENYAHPAGLFSAALYFDANAYHLKAKPLVMWLSDKAKKREESHA